jgi:hypothetical protein
VYSLTIGLPRSFSLVILLGIDTVLQEGSVWRRPIFGGMMVEQPTLSDAAIEKSLKQATCGRGAVERPQTIRARACGLRIKPQQNRMTRFWHVGPLSNAKSLLRLAF